MSKSFYRITMDGLLYAVCSDVMDEYKQLIIKLFTVYSDSPFEKEVLEKYIEADKGSSMKSIYHLLRNGWIDI